MRIAEIATLARPVPPSAEGSIESLVAGLVTGLTRHGHDVTLYATADSTAPATLRSPVPRGYRSSEPMWDWQLYEAWQVREAFRDADDFDLIHCHAYHHGLLFCDFVDTPSLHTVHVEPGPDYRFLAQRTRNRHLHFASHWQARDFVGLDNIHIIPHGIDLELFEPRPAGERGDYLLYLGRFLPEKGPLDAVALALRHNIPLRLAGPRNDWFDRELLPLVDGHSVQYVGEADPAMRRELLAGARALLYPLSRPEPFGLVLVEALASGTPVLACGGGAIDEIVEHGHTGWLGNRPEDLDPAIDQLPHFEPGELRDVAERRFSLQTMTGAIESVMRRIIEEQS